MIPITGHTQLTALLGSPVAHSISPLMHNEAFHLLDLDYTYLCFNVNEENLETAVMGLKTCGIRGFNLTMPNKNKIVELLDELSPAARLIGAVNTVVNDNGRLTGYNTDGVGYMQAVRDAEILSPVPRSGSPPRQGRGGYTNSEVPHSQCKACASFWICSSDFRSTPPGLLPSADSPESDLPSSDFLCIWCKNE